MAKWFEEALPPSYARGLELVDLVAVSIPARLCSQAIRTLGNCPDLRDTYPHLKRVKPLLRDDETADTKDEPYVLLLLGDNEQVGESLANVIYTECRRSQRGLIRCRRVCLGTRNHRASKSHVSSR